MTAIVDQVPATGSRWQINWRLVLFCAIWIGSHVAPRSRWGGSEPAIIFTVSQIALTLACVFRKLERWESSVYEQVAVAVIASELAAFFGLTPTERGHVLDTPVLVAIDLLVFLIAASVLSLQAIGAYRATEGSPNVRAHAAAVSIFPRPLLHLAEMEGKALWIAFFRWGRTIDAPSNSKIFPNYKSIAPLMYAFVAISLIEAILFHLIAHLLPNIVAIPLLLIGDVFIIYSIGLAKSLRIYPSYIHENKIRIRVGMFIDLTLDARDVASVRPVRATGDFRRSGCVKVSLLAYPNFIIEFTKQIPNPLPVKRSLMIDAVAIKFDDPVAFETCVSTWLGENR